jgi:hypothetical protein
MAKVTVTKGENLLIRKTLLKADGTALLYTDLSNSDTKINVYFQKSLIISYSKGTSTEIRQGTTTSQLEFELTKAFTSTLLGEYVIEYIFQVANTDFDVDLVQVNISSQELEVVKNGTA